MAGQAPGTQALSSSLTDLMTSLAIIFILLMVVFMKQASERSKRSKNAVETELQTLLTDRKLAISQDPSDPLSLRVSVGEAQLKFAVGSSTLPETSKAFVQKFFYDFARKICSPALRDKIDSVVVEGHTDAQGESSFGGIEKNLELSQRRSFNVLDEALRVTQKDTSTFDCLRRLASATGRGSADPILVEGKPHLEKSRRVEIKIRVRSTEQNLKSLISS